MSERTIPLRDDLFSSVQADSQLRLLMETGLQLARERKLDVIVQTALDTGLQLSAAAFGAFFCDDVPSGGVPRQIYKLAGPAELLASLRVPAPNEIFGKTLSSGHVFRSDDLTHDARTRGHLLPEATHSDVSSIRSYLAVPALSRTGETLGILIYAHPQPSVFSAQTESLLTTLAAQTAVAIENAHLAENLTREIAHADAARHDQRETSSRLRQALDAAQLGTWTWDLPTDLVDLDERAAQLFHVTAHTPMNRTELRQRVVHRDDLAHSAADLNKVLRHGGLYESEYRIQNPDGTQTWVIASGVPTYHESSRRCTGMTGTVQDITARKTQEATLRQSEKLAATGRLAATIAHEINNPLEAVTNLIYLCRTDASAPPALQRLLEAADDELARVSQIAQQTLGFYRDTARPVEIDLTTLLTGLANLFSRKLKYKQLTLKLELDRDLCIYGLQGEIRQVFSNLLVNAIEASDSGQIRIRARNRPVNGQSGVTVLLSDNGTGIAPEIRERLFSPFFTTKESLGTGLGLWVTRGMVEKHGGAISYRTCTQPPSGTVFRVFLPAKITRLEVFNSPSTEFLQ
jgi:PAS domain S-box-containing protein